MFSNNQKISSRQLKRMLVLSWVGRINLIIPSLAAGFSGRSGILGILVGVGFTLVYGIFISYVAKNVTGSLHDYLEVLLGKVGRFIVEFVFMALTVVNTAFTVRLLAELVQQCLLPDVNLRIIIGLALLVCGYGATGKIEGRGRTSEVLYGIILIPLVVMLCLSIPDLKTDYLMAGEVGNASEVLESGVAIFSIFSEISILLFTVQYVENKERLQAKVVQALVITGLSTIGVYVTTLGMFGSKGMQALKWPVVSLMSSVVVPGGFLNRWDIIFLALVLLSIFISLSGGVFYTSTAFRDLVGKGKMEFYILLALIPIFFLAQVFSSYDAILKFYLGIMKYCFIPVTFFIIFILWIMQKVFKRTVDKEGSYEG